MSKPLIVTTIVILTIVLTLNWYTLYCIDNVCNSVVLLNNRLDKTVVEITTLRNNVSRIEQIVNTRLNDYRVVVETIKPYPDKVPIPKGCSKEDYYSYMANVLAGLARIYAKHPKIKALANLTYLKKTDYGYVLVWEDGNPVAIEHGGNGYNEERWKEREYVEDPLWFWSNGRMGDCEDIAVAMATLLKAKGYNVTIVVGEWRGYGHAWVEVTINGTRYVGDTNVLEKYTDTWCLTHSDSVWGYVPYVRVVV